MADAERSVLRPHTPMAKGAVGWLALCFGGLAVTVILVTVVVPLAFPRHGPGSLDRTFGRDGIATIATDSPNDLVAIAVQPDGRIVAAGKRGFDFALTRYTAHGSLDASFGLSGTVTTDIGGLDSARAITLQPDGRIIVAGQTMVLGEQPVRNAFALARYGVDGALDPTFGSGGIVTTDVGAADELLAVAVDADGRIVAAGTTGAPGGAYALARYAADGALDAAFGDGGILTTDVGTTVFPTAIVIQPDGGIVVGGPAVVRYLPDGRLDRIFGTRGIVRTEGYGYPYSLALRPDGKLLVGLGGEGPARLLRLTSRGRLDATFGEGGTATCGRPRSLVSAIVVQHDGRILVGGTRDGDLELARCTPDGALDRAFGDGGSVTTDVGGSKAGLSHLAVQPDGRIVALGFRSAGCGWVPLCDSVSGDFVLAGFAGD